jgi:GWxTD domain-containing protein
MLLNRARVRCVALCVFVLSPFLLSTMGRAEPKIWVDYATFRSDNRDNTRVEVFLKLPTDSLGIAVEDGEEIVKVSLAVTVEDSAGRALLSDRWERRLDRPPQTAGPDHEVYFLDSSSLELMPGLYRLFVSVVDKSSDREDHIRSKLIVPSYTAPGLMVSDLLLTSTVPSPEVEGQFVLNGYRMIPSPDREFGARSSMIYVYQEIYQLQTRSVAEDSFRVSFRLLNEAGEEIRRYAATGGQSHANRAVKIAGLSIAGIMPGSYVLESTVEDQASGLRTRATRSFEIVPLSQSLLAEDVFTKADVEKSLNILSYIASSRERSLLSDLDETGKETFVARYWSAHDPDPGVPGNAYQDEMMTRYNYANERYGGHDEGWKTDRGRVYIIYGPPEEIERHVSNPGTRDYETWMYAFEGEATFVFVDERGYGQYRLVHSTARGELQYPEWETLIKPIDPDRGDFSP